jgi:4-hydroxymandelate oxidase
VQALSLRELEAEARPRLDPAAYDFFAGGADDEVTLRANEAAFSRIGLVPRVLRGAGPPSLGVELLSFPCRMPIIVAPTAFHRLAHPEGEVVTAEATARAGTILIVSMASTVSIEEVARAARAAAPDAPSNLWFQLYVQPDLSFTEAVVRRVERAGCTALVVSVDSPAFGRRERDLRNGFLDLPAGLWCENLREPRSDGTWGEPRSIAFWPELAWEHLDWLRGKTSLPLVLKGVTHPDDARLAIERGIDALMVSNHGGRQLDTVPASIDLLPPIVDAVDGRLPLLLDGGVRRGTDVVKALALGASAVAIGRPIVWGLAIDGAAGVASVLELLRAELERALTLCGCTSPTEVPRDLVRLRGMEGPCEDS